MQVSRVLGALPEGAGCPSPVVFLGLYSVGWLFCNELDPMLLPCATINIRLVASCLVVVWLLAAPECVFGLLILRRIFLLFVLGVGVWEFFMCLLALGSDE